MNNYWKSYYDLNSRQFDGAPLKQVGKTINGQEIPESQIKLIVENAANILRLDAKDSIIDLCCGNGLLTRQLAPLVQRVVGVDFTLGLIDSAKRYHSHPNIEYVNSDVLLILTSYFLGVQKLFMYEALQHFSIEQFDALLGKLCHLEVGSLFFLGSIPNREELRTYYDSEEKYAFYMQREAEGRPHIGRWWLMSEVEQLAIVHGFKATFLKQSPALYTAYYRFDVLLEKCR